MSWCCLIWHSFQVPLPLIPWTWGFLSGLWSSGVYQQSTFLVAVTLRSLVHFELMLVQGERLGCCFSPLQVEIQCTIYCIFWAPLSKIKLLWLCRFVSVSSILFHWSSCLFLCQCLAVFISIALKYSLKSGILIHPALLLWLSIALVLFSWFFSQTVHCLCLEMVLIFFYCWTWGTLWHLQQFLQYIIVEFIPSLLIFVYWFCTLLLCWKCLRDLRGFLLSY
jgi:hypothetical protein